MHPSIRRSAVQLVVFVLFCTAYYVPLLFDTSAFQLSESHARFLLHDALGMPTVQLGIAQNILGHIIPLAAYYAVLTWSAHHFSKATGLAHTVSRLLFLAAGWMLLVTCNAVLFPLSDYSFGFHVITKPVFAIGLAILLSMGVVFTIWYSRACRAPACALIAASILALITIPVVFGSYRVGNDTQPSIRNIIIIGVDSLSAATFKTTRAYLPHLSELFDHAITFDRAYTPLGRTFAAWVSILSGKLPVEHGGIFNLRNIDHVERTDLLSNVLRSQGYRTVFAIDERRFANIDTSFGFDRVIGPKVGALDFILQKANDTPLTNLLLQTGLGEWLLPYSRLNTASYANYDAEGFVRQALAATSGAQKLFLAVHFESSHYPFKSRHTRRKLSTANSFWNQHVEALTAVDAQIGQLIGYLNARGVLNDALVIVLSDHGEGLGDPEANTTKGGVNFQVGGHGHGASLLSDHQNRILLGMIQFQGGHPVQRESMRRDDLVSLVDIRHAVEDYVATGHVGLEASLSCLPVETGIRFSTARNYATLNEAELATESAVYYEIYGKGRIRLREETLADLIAAKDIGLRCRDRLTYFSQAELSYFAYAIADGGEQFTEVQPYRDDIAQIEAHRTRLMALPKP